MGRQLLHQFFGEVDGSFREDGLLHGVFHPYLLLLVGDSPRPKLREENAPEEVLIGVITLPYIVHRQIWVGFDDILRLRPINFLTMLKNEQITGSEENSLR
jgi:hypothetical protein